jgi:hypothetical protein
MRVKTRRREKAIGDKSINTTFKSMQTAMKLTMAMGMKLLSRARSRLEGVITILVEGVGTTIS